ncbi:TerC family protein [Bacillus vallismortis]|uniref:TerC family protein n=1 Tax=Bacillus vallismortis TaxID=72361 RepID=UPI000EF4F650|nr:TerC family protein [Bacillus vallismortis]MBG9770804.1 membrane protein [Bacillus vallismortis]MCI4137537.1 TerC family protein [Bacillus vallismortis]MCY7892805.1 TerC family protein [Bacillus vallismortis]MCY8545614.1 TerC family protein [Bacillus vallismortis]MEC1268115.1 TerC family protein [Bacillus vallismortis]
MESIWLEYAWTLLILIGLEGLLSADNALVLAVIAKHLPDDQKKRAINYGILMAFAFRFGALFAISFIANVWQIQAIGAAYLLYLGLKHVIKARFGKKNENIHEEAKEEAAGKGFWPTVGKIALADLAFAIDSILAAVALALGLPDSPLDDFGGMDGGQFAVVVLGGIAGLILIKFAATWFVKLLNQRPALETTAYAIVAWVGVKLVVITLAHEDIGILDHHFPHSTTWTLIFYGVLIAIALFGWFAPANKAAKK